MSLSFIVLLLHLAHGTNGTTTNASTCLKLNSNLENAQQQKSLDFDCDSSSFNLFHKCDNSWEDIDDDNAVNMTYFWRPTWAINASDERQLVIKDDVVFELDSEIGKTESDYFTVQKSPFKKVHEGTYRCQVVKRCDDGGFDVANYTYNVQLSQKQSSVPKAVLNCVGCDGDESGVNGLLFRVARDSDELRVKVQVIYPPCGIITPIWLKNGVQMAFGEEYRIGLGESDETDQYECKLVGSHGDWIRKFKFKLVDAAVDDADMVQILAGIGIAVFMVILVSVGVVVLKKCQPGKPRGLQKFDQEGMPMLISAENPLQCQSYATQFEALVPPDLHAKCSDLGGSRHWIGSGHFGEVYLCTVEAKKFPLLHSSYDEKRRVAVKTWKVNSRDPNFVQEFENIIDELNIMISVEKSRMNFDRGLSQFVIQLIGCGMTPGETLDDGITIKNEPAPFLVLEYADNGDLLKFLRDHKQRGREKGTIGHTIPYAGLSYADLTKFAYQIASGMVFLSENKIVHRDLAARNILVSSDYTMKISDFGLSKEKDYYIARRGNKLPWKWMAIESIQDHKSNVYTDVWSFGVTMWEIFSLGNQPYPTRTPEDVRNFLESGARLDRPQYASRQLYQIMRDCWKAEPTERPKFRDLADDLEKELETLDRERQLDMNGDDSDSGLGDGQVTPDTAPPRPPPVLPPPAPPVSPRTDV